MKIAICDCTTGFEGGWIEKCKSDGLDFVLLRPYDGDLIAKLKELKITHFLWHWHHSSPRDWLFARQLLLSVEEMGIKVFPDIRTCCMFDDKIGEKYLLESLDLPLVKTWVFYYKKEALDWARSASWPKVFKLRAGAGSKNVVLVKSYSQCKRLISTMFGPGIPSANVAGHIKGTAKIIKKSPMFVLKKIGRIPHYIKGIMERRKLPRQRGYCLFQEFVPNNKSDIRIVVVGDHAIGLRRMVPAGDFRASGSGMIDYDYRKIPIETVQTAFRCAQRLKSQSLAIDFVTTESGEFLIVEISYGYSAPAYYSCPGYWDKSLIWHEDGNVRPEYWILENLIGAK